MDTNTSGLSRHPIHALEHALQVYESATFAIDLISQAQRKGVCLFAQKLGTAPIHAPLGHVRFRDFLLQAATTPFEPSRIQEYGGVDLASLERYPEGFRSFIKGNTPVGLYRWNASSRRVFELSEDLQLLLENTDVKNLKISEVPWPFDSFVVTTPKKLGSGFEGASDCMLVTIVRDPKGSGEIINFILRLFPSPGAPNLVLSPEEKASFQRMLRQERWLKLTKKLIPRMDAWSAYQIGEASWLEDVSVNTSFDGDRKIRSPELGGPVDRTLIINQFQTSLNLAIGLSFFLTTIKSSGGERSEWTKLPSGDRTSDPRAITNPSEVCTISCVHRLTDEERQVMRRESGRSGGYEVCAHFRRGHWRRLPGKGSEASAEKVIWVRPTLVRRDRLPDNSLPVGSKTQM